MDTAPDGVIKPLFSAGAIATRVDQLASEIATTRLNDLMVVAVLKGSFIFAADLIRALHRQGLKPEIDFIYLANYDGDRISRGEVRVVRDVGSDVRGRNVVIVDDIFELGPDAGLCQVATARWWCQPRAHLRAPGQASAACGADHPGLCGIFLPAGVRGRLRHGFPQPLPRASLYRRADGWLIGPDQALEIVELDHRP